MLQSQHSLLYDRPRVKRVYRKRPVPVRDRRPMNKMPILSLRELMREREAQLRQQLHIDTQTLEDWIV